MSNEIEFTIRGDYQAGPAFKRANEDLDKLRAKARATSADIHGLGGETDRVKPKITGLGDESERTGRKVDLFGQNIKRSADGTSGLDNRIKELREGLQILGREFERTADPAILKKFRTDSDELRGLRSLRKEIDGLAGDLKNVTREGGQAASTFASLFQGGIINALKSPVGAGIAAGVAIPASIGVAGVAGGLIGAGAGIGAVAGGVFGATQNSPDVAAEAKRQAGIVADLFRNATKGWVGPTIEAIKQLGGAVRDIHFDKIFGSAVNYVAPLTQGIVGLTKGLGKMVEELVTHAGPEIEVLKEELPDLGHAFENFGESVAGGSKGGADALKDLLNFTEAVVIGTGKFIGYGEGAYHTLTKWNDGARDLVRTLREQNGLLYATLAPADYAGRIFDDDSDRAKHFAYQFRTAADAAAEFGDESTTAFYNTADAARDLDDAFNALFGQTMNLQTANLQVQAGMIDLRKELQANGDTLDSNTEKGNANAEAILGQVKRYEQQREAAIAAGNGTREATEKANAAYATNIASLRAVLIQMGFNIAEVNALIGAYGRIPDEIDTHVNTYYHNYYTSSNSPIGPEERKYGPNGKASGGIIGGAASGKITGMGAVGVAEHGRELALLAPGYAQLPPGSQIIPNGQTERALTAGGAAGAGPSGDIPIITLGGSDFDEFLVGRLRQAVQRRGGQASIIGIKI